MPPSDLSYTYTTRAAIERMLSVAGVRARLDHDNDDLVSTDEAELSDDCVTEATETINFYCYAKYDPARLAESNMVHRWATVYGSYALCGTRGMDVPDIIQERIEKIEEKLEKVQLGRIFLPGVALRRNQAPTWDNIRCDPRFRWNVIRVQKRSSSKQPTDQPVRPDFGELYSMEW